MKQINVPKERLAILWILTYIGSGLLAMRLLDIQIIRYQYYKQAAERNRTQIIRQTAPRGRIFSSDSVILATNRPAFSLIYLPGRINDIGYLQRLARNFSEKLKVPVPELIGKLQKSFDRGTPVRIAENLSAKTMFSFSELRTLYPGMDIIVESQRFYPLGNFASHLIGYIGMMDSREWNLAGRSGGEYRMDSRIGKSGIEKNHR